MMMMMMMVDATTELMSAIPTVICDTIIKEGNRNLLISVTHVSISFKPRQQQKKPAQAKLLTSEERGFWSLNSFQVNPTL